MPKCAEDDDISNANTEDSLIQSSRNSSETICTTSTSSSPDDKCNEDNLDEDAPIIEQNLKQSRNYNLIIYLLLPSLICLLWALATLIWPPFNLLMDLRLRMTPGLPPYELWKHPPDEVLIRAYIFNVTNAQQFLSRQDTKLNITEIGPIIYMEKLTHSNVTFNKNGTMTYVATRQAIYLPEQNHIDLNSTIIVPNWALLGIASYLSEESFFIKLAVNLLIRSIKPEPFRKLTIHQLLWNYTDPLLDACHNVAPSMVPMKNLGILNRIYANYSNTVTVRIGPKYTHQDFFLIDKYDGSPYLPNYGSACSDLVSGATEGVTYPQFLSKNDTILYWRKTMCKNAKLLYEKEETKYGILGYRFTLPPNTFNRTNPSELDCYKGIPELLDGLSDVSKCHFGFPLASSFPHFLHSEKHGKLLQNVNGLKPNLSRHESFVIIDPITGVPMESHARSQSNLIVRKLSGFNNVAGQFSDMVIPMFWLEYNQVGLPWHIAGIVFFQTNILPIFQRFFTAILFALGLLLIVLVYLRCKRRKSRQQQSMAVQNQVLIFEKELFLRK